MSRFVSDIIRASQHHWSNILSSLAIPIPHLNKHGPCPVCGGKDRFRLMIKRARNVVLQLLRARRWSGFGHSGATM